MHRLPFIIWFTLLSSFVFAQNPHGDSFAIDCGTCHNPNGWEISIDTFHFNHDTTSFPLQGQHKMLDCKLCHTDFIFQGTTSDCIDCHNDIHNMTVGEDCSRCHNSSSWLVDNIPELHEANGFPLLGAHAGLYCTDCHQSDSQIRFDRLGNDCINCHLEDYENTMEPNHKEAGYSEDCFLCHSSNSKDWEADVFEHGFFPLTLGHDIRDCKRCHLGEELSDISAECISCHLEDFNNTVTPDHEVLGFDNDCVMCHTTEPGWRPAIFLDHDAQFFPIYSGAHEGEWNECTDCHTNPNDFSIFSCIVCHGKSETDGDHEDVTGYVYEDRACLACHPNGSEDDNFNHNNTGFPLTGAHVTVDCLECHENGFAGTPTDCFACHGLDFEGTLNPDHQELNLSTDCINCHTTDPEWMPASFDIHDEFYPLLGAHAIIADECVKCHNGDYNNTPNDCFGCHSDDYNEVTDPNHLMAGFSTDCTTCHTQDSWVPSTFDHDVQHFPIYSGKHEGEWVECVDCHNVAGDFKIFTCIGCHTNPETDNEHEDVPGYFYDDNACLGCHPTGDADMAFDHNMTAFPLTGAHVGIDCMLCHENGFEGTPTDCASCHLMDFEGSLNPNHQELGLSNDCINCHTTEPGWMPATFDIHDQFYTLNGAHIAIANDCVSCHNGDYNNTPNDCFGCHSADYNSAVDPNHLQAGFSTDCLTCHTEDSWTPSTFDHDVQYFPIYSGKHEGEWMECMDCHNVAGNFKIFTCIGCHINPETDEVHDEVPGYIYNDNACFGCHPAGDADMAFDHNMTAFPLTGAHLGVDCALCHTDGFAGTSTNCMDCHEIDFGATMNPNHSTLGIPTDCINCHTTEPGWMPATFDIHDQYYALNGAHSLISNDCAACHNGDYNNTPNDCVACHLEDYNMTTNPNHTQTQFGTDCVTCHNENAWVPSTFDHDAQYFPINSGAHLGEWMMCTDCHTDPNNFSIFSCIVCHLNPETDNEHIGVGGYIYNDNACFSCHPSGEAMDAFDHNSTSFPLTGAHIGVDCLDCHDNGFAGTPTDCFACHNNDFNNSLNPNHSTLGIPTDCISCHTTEPGWMPATFDIHDQYYALNGAHSLISNDCLACHNGDYNNTPNDCVGCHLEDYNMTTNPNHSQVQFGTDCVTCHSENAWVPSTFDHDAQYFPINSGAHLGEWMLCTDCHTDPNDFSIFSCIICHLNPETDNEHIGVGGYIYNDIACFSCHPTGESMGAFDHNTTSFALTGAHIGVDCLDCHENGFVGTPTDCFACHSDDFNNSINPNHNDLGIPTDCIVCHTTEPGWAPATFDIHDQYYALTGAHMSIANDCVACHNGDYNNTPNTCDACHTADYEATENPSHTDLMLPMDCQSCHTTEPGWMPATFDIHNDFYELLGEHALIADDCISCHNGNYNNTPNDCVGCHLDDYNDTTNPNHSQAQFSTDCTVCHNEDAWMPSTFDHDVQYFPIYSGTHAGEWMVCMDCHLNPNNFAEFTCISCHLNPETDNDHNGVGGYLYNDDACFACHPTGESMGAIDHNTTAFPLTGAHIGVDCFECHINGFAGTPTDCYACHSADFDNSNNPDHQDLGIPTDCIMCHITDPGWMPATFDIHDDYYELTGAHLSVADDCVLCHNGNYNNTPNTCDGCHLPDYNSTTNPDHQDLGFPTNCDDCHTTDPGWVPATFDIHDDYYELTGAHLTIADDCVLCHNGNYNNTPNTCDGCHLPDYNSTTNPDHQDLNLPVSCDDCHTTDPGWMPATFDIHDDYYELNGAHAIIANDCVLCHDGDYSNTPNTCVGCHQSDYDNTTSPDHGENNLSTECLDCHNEDAWMPSDFDHDDFYVLNGAHMAIQNDCFACHMGEYVNTPTECIGCHQMDYDETDNPDHASAMFPTDCLLCHTEDAWSPSSFNHDGMYFPIYSGKHEDEWNLCVDCHINANDYSIFSCIDCHEHDNQNDVDDDHEGVSGYIYESTACYSCHPTGEEL